VVEWKRAALAGGADRFRSIASGLALATRLARQWNLSATPLLNPLAPPLRAHFRVCAGVTPGMWPETGRIWATWSVLNTDTSRFLVPKTERATLNKRSLWVASSGRPRCRRTPSQRVSETGRKVGSFPTQPGSGICYQNEPAPPCVLSRFGTRRRHITDGGKGQSVDHALDWHGEEAGRK